MGKKKKKKASGGNCERHLDNAAGSLKGAEKDFKRAIKALDRWC